MKVLLFHPCQLPPKDYGGVERVVLWLAQGLFERGHEVTIAAFPDSKLPQGVNLLPVEPTNKNANLLLALKLNQKLNYDIVHFMAPPEEGVIEKLGIPSVTTIHGNGVEGEVFPKNSIFLSQDHARRHGSQRFVYNGINPDEYKISIKKSDSFLFLSKTSWKVKNLRGAIRYCKEARVILKIAGGNRPYIERVKAWLSGFSWEGAVTGAKKAELLSEAQALIFPIIWDEPFGLVVIEALMSGTPVIARSRGSLTELVTNEVGVLCKSDEEFVHALKNPPRMSPEVLRSYAIEKFSHRRMAENYEKSYKEAISS
ncbi:MAG: glycosyltransferase [Xanthomonadaceae bacterium]|nr:glycosyltransferase [Xanthomonadaceae bacterium]